MSARGTSGPRRTSPGLHGEGEQQSWGLYGGGEYSDNVLRTDVDETSDTIINAGATLNLDMQRPHMDLRAAGNIQYRDYVDNTADGEILGGVNAGLSFIVSPEKFYWVIEENYGQIATDSRQVDSPENRQDFNLFSTGPEIALPLGARTDFLAGGRWSRANYGETEADSQRLSGNVGLLRQLSQSRSLSLNATVEDVDFDGSGILAPTDYQVREAFLRFEGAGRKTTMLLDAGYTELRPDGRETRDGGLFRLTVDHVLGARSSFSWNLGHEFADGASVFRQDQSFGGVQMRPEDALANADPFTSDTAGVVLRMNGVRTEVSLTANWRREEHDTQTDFDRDVASGAVYVTRRISPRWNVSLTGVYQHDDFVETGDVVHEWSVGASVSRQLTPSVDLSLGYTHYSANGEGSFNDYDENRALLRVTYNRVL